MPLRFTPKSPKFANEECGGVNIVVTDRVAFRPVATGAEIAYQLNLLHSGTWKVDDYIRLLANRAALAALKDGKIASQIAANVARGFGTVRSHQAEVPFSTEKDETKKKAETLKRRLHQWNLHSYVNSRHS